MPDQFQTGLMLGRVLELAEHTATVSEHTARKVDVIEARQMGLIQRIDKLESVPSPKGSTPVGKVVLAVIGVLAGLFANLKAEHVGEGVAALVRGLSH
jgi:hypothetical protein